jgi:hypothetical protein
MEREQIAYHYECVFGKSLMSDIGADFSFNMQGLMYGLFSNRDLYYRRAIGGNFGWTLVAAIMLLTDEDYAYLKDRYIASLDPI